MLTQEERQRVRYIANIANGMQVGSVLNANGCMHGSTGRAVTVDPGRRNLLDYGSYLQEMLPKYIQQTQLTHGYVLMWT